MIFHNYISLFNFVPITPITFILFHNYAVPTTHYSIIIHSYLAECLCIFFLFFPCCFSHVISGGVLCFRLFFKGVRNYSLMSKFDITRRFFQCSQIYSCLLQAKIGQFSLSELAGHKHTEMRLFVFR